MAAIYTEIALYPLRYREEFRAMLDLAQEAEERLKARDEEGLHQVLRGIAWVLRREADMKESLKGLVREPLRALAFQGDWVTLKPGAEWTYTGDPMRLARFLSHFGPGKVAAKDPWEGAEWEIYFYPGSGEGTATLSAGPEGTTLFLDWVREEGKAEDYLKALREVAWTINQQRLGPAAEDEYTLKALGGNWIEGWSLTPGGLAVDLSEALALAGRLSHSILPRSLRLAREGEKKPLEAAIWEDLLEGDDPEEEARQRERLREEAFWEAKSREREPWEEWSWDTEPHRVDLWEMDPWERRIWEAWERIQKEESQD